MHDHNHDHEHGHKHNHQNDAGADKLTVVLPHLLQHNQEHVKDIQKWLKISEESGKSAVAEDLRRVAQLYEEISILLESALDKSRA